MSFTAIPYAAPPLGERRFRPPERHPGWSGVRGADGFAPEAPQQSAEPLWPRGMRRADWSEDCLHLNVHTPATDTGRRPVMVWIHGGAFVDGASSRVPFDPTRAVEDDDVVVVTINYRLGALGWLYLGHLDERYADSGNVGLLDQIAALEWVRDNIDRFGGDPGNVTAFGSSAGGMSVAALLASPAAAGLFHRAICQSGAGQYAIEPELAATFTERFLQRSLARSVDDLADIVPERITKVQKKVASELSAELELTSRIDTYLLLGPVVDGRTLTARPHDAIAAGSAAGIPLIAGTNADEYSYFGRGRAITEDGLQQFVGRLAGPAADRILATYRRTVSDDPGAIWEAVQTDRLFTVPARRLVEAQRAHQPANTFLYLFRWSLPGEPLGATHSLEQPFVFDNLESRRLGNFGALTGRNPPAALAVDMRRAWTTFAHDGAPNGAGLPTWPTWSGDRSAMVYDDPAGAADDPMGDRVAAWDGVL